MKSGIYACILFLIGVSCSGTDHDEEGHHHDDEVTAYTPPKDTLASFTVDATPHSPEYVQLATNVEIVPNIKAAVASVGVLTHEGVFGPLLFAEEIRAFFIELKPGMFLSEHPHPTESIVYTVSGKWVLCSEGKRQIMEEGSVFHFGSNIPTGWEAPFEEGALLLVVKSKEEGETFEPYVTGLKEMRDKLDAERKEGEVFYFNELEDTHPAIKFGKSVNPNFGDVLTIKY